MGDDSARDEFVEALRLLASEGIQVGDATPETSAAITVVYRHLRTFLLRYRSLGDSDFEDLVASVCFSLVEVARSGEIDFAKNPKSFALTRARWMASNHVRRTLHEVSQLEYVDPSQLARLPLVRDDNDTARVLEREATADLVSAALRDARESGDRTAYQVAIYYLDFIERHGTVPSAREAAGDLNLSHTGVLKALRRFRILVQGALRLPSDSD